MRYLCAVRLGSFGLEVCGRQRKFPGGQKFSKLVLGYLEKRPGRPNLMDCGIKAHVC